MTKSDSAAHGFLEEAVTTMRQRAQLRDAGNGERSMARTVAIFKAWTDIDISEEDGWRFMIALKQARESQGKFNRDDYVDLAAYAGLLGECESGGRPTPILGPTEFQPKPVVHGGPFVAQDRFPPLFSDQIRQRFESECG